MAYTMSEQVRMRLREEMQLRNLNQSDIAGMLAWTQSRVSKILNGKIQLGLDELAAICFALGISIVEVVRDHGLQFCAEMTPSEMRFLERLRQLPQTQRDAMMQLFHIESTTRPQERRAAPPRPRNKA